MSHPRSDTAASAWAVADDTRLMLWSSTPAIKVVERLIQLPSPFAADNNVDANSGPAALQEAGQAAFLALLRDDPLLALLGLRPTYRRSLLKRLLAEVEARRLAVADELVVEYTMALIAADMPGGLDKDPEDWLYKTFAYGPMPAPAARRGAAALGITEAACSNGSSGSEGQDALDPLAAGPTLPPPLPVEIVRRHVAVVEAALGRARRSGGVAGIAEANTEQGPELAVDASPASLPGKASAAAAMNGSDSAAGAYPLCCCCNGRPTTTSGAAAAAAVAAAARPLVGADGTSGGVTGLVTLRLSSNLLAGSTGCHEWESGFAMAQWVLRRPGLFAGHRVLELGSGAGLLGVVLARVGAALVAATDGSAAAVANCAANLRLNLPPQDQGGCALVECSDAAELARVEQGVAVCRLEWEAALPPQGLRCDVVVAADVMYNPDVVPVLVSLLARLLQAPPGARGQREDGGATVAYVASMLRNPTTMELFLRSAVEAGLAVETLSGWGDADQTRGGGCDGCDGDGVTAPVRWHLCVLDDPSVASRILLHRITWAR